MDTTLEHHLEEARALLAAEAPDAEAYGRLERYALANCSRLAAEPHYHNLVETLEAYARRHGLPTLESRQEGFGLNSCAQ